MSYYFAACVLCLENGLDRNAAEAEVCDLICCLSDLFCGTFHIIEALCLRKDLFVGCVVGCDGSRLDRSFCHIIDNTET